jgi:hypothetical protein
MQFCDYYYVGLYTQSVIICSLLDCIMKYLVRVLFIHTVGFFWFYICVLYALWAVLPEING